MQINCIKNLPGQLNEAGKIKIGMKGETIKSQAGNEFKLPKKLDHFIITTTEKDEDGNFIPDTELMNNLKKDPKLIDKNGNLNKLPIRFLYDDLELNFPTRYISYVGGKMSCYGDGEKSFKRLKKNFTEVCQCPCARLDPGYDGKDKCKATGALGCVIDGSELFGQRHTFRTTSMNSITGIFGGSELIKAATSGRIAGLPLMLTINPKTTTTPAGKSTVIQVVSICYRGSMEDLRNNVIKMLTEEKQYLLGMDSIEKEAQKNKSLIDITPDSEDEKDFIEEFYPDARNESDVDNENESDVDNENKNHDKIVESDNSFIGDEPEGPYKKVYEAFLKENDIDKAMSFLQRLKKENIQYWISTKHPHIYFSEKILKPKLLEISKTILEANIKNNINDKNLNHQNLIDQQPIEIQKHSLIVDLRNVNTQIDAANLCTKFFLPQPIDRTQSLEDLTKMAIKQIKTLLAKKKAENQKIVNVETHVESLDAKNLDNTKIDIENKTNTLKKWDNSGPIEKNQKLLLIKLKKEAESTNILNPGDWEIQVAQFKDADGKPLQTAKNMSKNQANHFIQELQKIIETPF